MFASANIYGTTKLRLSLSMLSLNSKIFWILYPVKNLTY